MTGDSRAGRDPWADPATPTQDGEPYCGPPATGPPAPYPPGSYAGGPYPPVYGAGYPAWGWAPPPRPPRRPGRVITSAVLALVQAALVLFATLYVYFAVSLADLAVPGTPGLSSARADQLIAEGRILIAVQVVSAVLLIGGGLLALNRRDRVSWKVLLASHAVQVLLAGYWGVRLGGLVGAGTDGVVAAPLIGFTLFFLAGPVVGIGMAVSGPGRRWFGPPAPEGPGSGPA